MDALRRWGSLRKDEQTVVITYMTIDYDATFTSSFLKHARAATGDLLIVVTNRPSDTSNVLPKQGYRLRNTSSRGIEYWVHPSGKEQWVVRGGGDTIAETTGATETTAPSPTKQSATGKGDNPYIPEDEQPEKWLTNKDLKERYESYRRGEISADSLYWFYWTNIYRFSAEGDLDFFTKLFNDSGFVAARTATQEALRAENERISREAIERLQRGTP